MNWQTPLQVFKKGLKPSPKRKPEKEPKKKAA
jgi:hypothetical protein